MTSTNTASFKSLYTLEARKIESARIKLEHPGRIPVIIEKLPQSNLPNVDKVKYLVPHDLTVGQLIYVVRKRLPIAPEQAIYVLVNSELPPALALISDVYKESADPDGFLYVEYTGKVPGEFPEWFSLRTIFLGAAVLACASYCTFKIFGNR
jgi:GABA(A) receptor-associated protein